MRRILSITLAVSLVLPSASNAAAEISVEEIKKQVLEELKPMIDAEVERRVREELEKRQAAVQPSATAPAADVPPAETAARAWSPSDEIRLLEVGPAYLNMSLITDIVVGWSTADDVSGLQGAHHDPNQEGFNLTGFELVLDGAVDPYFYGRGTVTMVLTEDGETEIELEEAFAETTSLPANLQLRAGQFYATFGQHNTLHNHSWSFVDQPIVITRLLGEDGLRNVGAQVSWLAPTPFYAELILGITNNDGESFVGAGHEHGGEEEEAHAESVSGGEPVERTVRGPDKLLFVPRLVTSFDLNDTQTLLLGTSGAIGPNDSGSDGCTWIVGGDLIWRWRPVDAERGFPFVQVQAEGLYRQYEADERISAEDETVTLPEEDFGDWGFYSQVLYGFTPGWVAGLRGEFVSGEDVSFEAEGREDRTRISPNLTWYPSEFSQLRWQYNYDHIQGWGDEHTVWMQLEFSLGAHGAHKFGQ